MSVTQQTVLDAAKRLWPDLDTERVQLWTLGPGVYRGVVYVADETAAPVLSMSELRTWLPDCSLRFRSVEVEPLLTTAGYRLSWIPEANTLVWKPWP